ncbi:hypothetical protein Tco_0064617 [Tanacetum coccineum]
MLLCKKEAAGIQVLLTKTDDNSGPTYDTEPLEKVDSNVTPDSSNMSTNEREVGHHSKEPEDERVLFASKIVNSKADVDENKKIKK